MSIKGVLAVTGTMIGITGMASAQQYVAQVAKVMPKRYIEPSCDLSAGHYLVSSGATYLAVGSGGNQNVKGTTDPEKVRQALDNGIRVIGQAIRDNSQGDNPAAWYFLGRLHLQGGDVAGADSSFAKASEMAPACAEDIQSWRQRAWMPVITLASEMANAGNDDSAIVLFRRAATISDSRPEGPYNMGVLFANLDETDSAITYFRRTQEIAAGDPDEYGKQLRESTFNLAAMLQRANNHADAAVELAKYIEWAPNDVEAKRALATSYRAIGNNDDAAAIEKEVLAAAEEAGTLSAGDRLAIGVAAFQEENYERAAEAFEAVLVDEPYNRDALYNLSNTYYAMQNGEKLVEVAPRLVAIEPLNEDSHKLLAQGNRMAGLQDELMAGVEELMAIRASVAVTGFVPSPAGAALSGYAMGRDAERDGEALPAMEQSLVVEFLNSAGEVVATSDLDVPALEPAARHEWSVSVEAPGIRYWRYKVKGDEMGG